MVDKIGIIGKCSLEYQKFVDDVERQLELEAQVGGQTHVQLPDCAAFEVSQYFIKATTKHKRGIKETVVIFKDATVTSYLERGKKLDIGSVTRSSNGPDGYQPYNQAGQRVLNWMDPANVERARKLLLERFPLLYDTQIKFNDTFEKMVFPIHEDIFYQSWRFD